MVDQSLSFRLVLPRLGQNFFGATFFFASSSCQSVWSHAGPLPHRPIPAQSPDLVANKESGFSSAPNLHRSWALPGRPRVPLASLLQGHARRPPIKEKKRNRSHMQEPLRCWCRTPKDLAKLPSPCRCRTPEDLAKPPSPCCCRRRRDAGDRDRRPLAKPPSPCRVRRWRDSCRCRTSDDLAKASSPCRCWRWPGSMTSPSRCHRWTGRCRTWLLPLPTGCNKAPETLCPRRRSRSETKQLTAATLPASSALYLRRGLRWAVNPPQMYREYTRGMCSRS